MKSKMRRLFFFYIAIIPLPIFSCKKLVNVEAPNNRVIKATAYSNNQTAIAIMNGVYVDMASTDFTGYRFNSIPLITGLSSDDLTFFNFGYSQELGLYYSNNLEESTMPTTNIWTTSYPQIYTLNDIIEGTTDSKDITASVKDQLLGEAKFTRALFYFSLVNLYGDVPLVLTTDYKKNSILDRTKQDEVYKQIINDLKDAESLLSDNFLDGSLLNNTSERVRPTKWAASALLSKVYLYSKNWDLAEAEATKVINNTSMFELVPLNQVFIKNSKEAILQLQPTTGILNTVNAQFFVLPDSSGPTYDHPTTLSTSLINSFEYGDLRKDNWAKKSTTPEGDEYWFPFKYKAYLPITTNDPLSEYLTILRLSDQYLIRAEARAQKDDLAGAKEDIKTVRNRAGLSSTTAANKSDILNAIYHERRMELFTEWGDRWFDLRRSTKIDNVMNIETPIKGGHWSNYKKFYPINQGELLSGINLKQTPGY